MDPAKQIEQEIEKYLKERSELLDEVCKDEMGAQQIRMIIEKWTDQLLYHMMELFKCGRILYSQGKQNTHSRETEQDKEKKEKKVKINRSKKKNEEKQKEHFKNLVNKYHSTEYTEDKWNQNAWKDCDLDEHNWHTKSKWPKQGLHLVVHHLGNKNSKQAFRYGFTIVKDPRFLNGKDGHWPLRIELEPVFDKTRKTRTYIVIKNEFGKRELYSKFYKRMLESGLTLNDYKEVLDANRDGLWKKHPMRKQTDGNNITWTPLRFNLNREQWKKVIENKSFADVTITRQLGKNWRDDQQLAKEIVAYADENGMFNISEQILENWRRANKFRAPKGEDMNVDQSKTLSQN